MKISSIAAIILGFSAPLVSAEGAWKGTDMDAKRRLQNKVEDGGIAFPTLEELEDLYGNFCNLCCLGDIFDADQAYCAICPDDACDFLDDILNPDLDLASLCFSEISTVQVENMGNVAMKNLQVGARVLTSSGTYEPVYAFGHKNPTESADFLQFKTAGSNLEITGGHLVFLDGKTNPVRADSVKVGDVLRTTDAGAKITKIRAVQRDGVYAPLTPGGTVVVDGIVASSYISLQKNAEEFVELQGGISTFLSYQYFLHMALSPFRMFTMGVSSSMGNTYTTEGIPTFAAAGMDLAKWADSQNTVVQVILFLVFFAVAGASMVMESTFGASMAPLALATGVGVYAVLKKKNSSIRAANKIKSV